MCLQEACFSEVSAHPSEHLTHVGDVACARFQNSEDKDLIQVRPKYPRRVVKLVFAVQPKAH